MPSPIELAIRQICEEKGLAYESVIDAIEAALAAAYRKDFGDKNQNIEVKFNTEDGTSRVFDIKTVVEDMDLEELEKIEEMRRVKAEEFATRIEQARMKGDDIAGIELEEIEGAKFNPKTDIMLSEEEIKAKQAQQPQAPPDPRVQAAQINAQARVALVEAGE
ncbi:hypothetical protein EBS80_01195, partial [bacterium]|nr:hypothetical protein [bacterium]